MNIVCHATLDASLSLDQASLCSFKGLVSMISNCDAGSDVACLQSHGMVVAMQPVGTEKTDA